MNRIVIDKRVGRLLFFYLKKISANTLYRDKLSNLKEGETVSEMKIIPFGGVREHGRNLYAIEINDEIYILDCGLKVPETEMLGIDVVIPDFTYLMSQKEKIAGIFLTHGHADAIGALPYLLEHLRVPVFGSELTIALAEMYTKEYEPTKKFRDFHAVNEGTEIDFSQATISFFKVTHSIPDALGIVVHTKEGNIVYTGDFKFDQSAQPMYQTDYAHLAQIGAEGVLMLLSDSSSADNPTPVASERQIAEEMTETFRYWEGRIIAACVSSNIQRIQQILNAAEASYRKVVIMDEKVNKVLRIAMNFGKLCIPSEDLIIPLKEMKKYPDDELVILEAGHMGEPIQAIQKMAKQHHRHINIKEGDLVYLATTPSLAMEMFVVQTENLIYKAGGDVKTVSDNFRASGHGDPDDLRLLYNLLKPKYCMPIQGEYRELQANCDIMHEQGVPWSHLFLASAGDVIEWDVQHEKFTMTGSVQAENVMIDGLGVGDIGNIVLRDRKVLSEDGIFVAVVTIDRKKKKIVSRPKITSRGFVYVKANRDLIKESADMVTGIIENYLSQDDFEWNDMKQDIRDQLSRYLFAQTRRRPVILPVIMEATQRRRHRKS